MEKTYEYGVFDGNGNPIADQDLNPEIKSDIDAYNRRGLGEHGDLLVALEKFQEMRESGEFCCLDIKSDYDFVWGVSYVRDADSAHARKGVGSFNSYTLVEALNEAYDLWKKGELE